MFIGTENQFRHLFVVNKVEDVTSTSEAGTIQVKSDNDHKHLKFDYKDANNVIHSDLVNVENILSVAVTDAKSMRSKLKKATVTLTSNSGNPIVGQDYILNVDIRNYVALGDESVLNKFGAVHGYKNMTTSDWYAQMAVSLAKNFGREPVKLLKFVLVDKNDSKIEVLPETKLADLDAANKGYKQLDILEAEQYWRRGLAQQEPVNFIVTPTNIIEDGEDVLFGEVAYSTEGEIKNGKRIADMEWFYLGNRGDAYRGLGYPHNFVADYLVDPSVEYNTIDLHYSYVGSGVDVAKSERTITLVVPKKGDTNATANVLTNSVITAINTATGLNVALLDVSSASTASATSDTPVSSDSGNSATQAAKSKAAVVK